MFYGEVFRTLNNHKVRYLVSGGVAVVLHGVLRFTADLDLIVDFEPGNLNRLLLALDESGYKPKLPVRASDFLDPANRKLWTEEKNMIVFSFYNREAPHKMIDIFVEELIPFNTLDIAKKIVSAGGIDIPVVSLQHLVELKKLANRRQDLSDIDSLEELARRMNNESQSSQSG